MNNNTDKKIITNKDIQNLAKKLRDDPNNHPLTGDSETMSKELLTPKEYQDMFKQFQKGRGGKKNKRKTNNKKNKNKKRHRRKYTVRRRRN